MLFLNYLLGIYVYLIFLLALVAVIGDYAVQYSELQVYRAIFDNATHAAIGGLSWLIVCLNFRNRFVLQTLLEIALCTITASFIDLDHFFSARSFHLKDAMQLQSRPPLHCSSLSLLLTLTVISIAYLIEIRWMLRVGFILLTAFASHHTRDATRRGFWIYPWGSTSPIPYILYITLTIMLPYFVSLGMYYLDLEKPMQYVRIV